jgi:hypothetical protein
MIFIEQYALSSISHKRFWTVFTIKVLVAEQKAHIKLTYLDNVFKIYDIINLPPRAYYAAKHVQDVNVTKYKSTL